MVDLLEVPYRRPVTARVDRLLHLARAEAGRRLCPEQAAAPGRDVEEKPQGAGRFFHIDESQIDIRDTPLTALLH